MRKFLRAIIGPLVVLGVLQRTFSFLMPTEHHHRHSSTTTTTTSTTFYSSHSPFEKRSPPYVCLITETNACDSPELLDSTLTYLKKAVATNLVDLISVRVAPLEDPKLYHRQEANIISLVQQLKSCSTQRGSNFSVVLSSDWRHLAKSSGADGVHFKESHRPYIPSLRTELPNLLVGTSTHTIESAIEAYKEYQPDYFFAGTCYLTASHPEKDQNDLEGPQFPGQVKESIEKECGQIIPVIAIGGIDEQNCHEPIAFGASGVAAIRAVSQANDAEQAVRRIQNKMEASMLAMKESESSSRAEHKDISLE